MDVRRRVFDPPGRGKARIRFLKHVTFVLPTTHLYLLPAPQRD